MSGLDSFMSMVPGLGLVAGLADMFFGDDEPNVSQVRSPQQAQLYNQISPLIGRLSGAANASAMQKPSIYSPMRSRFTGYAPPQGGYQHRQRPAQPWWSQRTQPGMRPNMGRPGMGPQGMGQQGGQMNPQMLMQMLNMARQNPQMRQKLGL